MSDQNPYPWDIRHSQIPVGCPTPPPLGLTLMGALEVETHRTITRRNRVRSACGACKQQRIQHTTE